MYITDNEIKNNQLLDLQDKTTIQELLMLIDSTIEGLIVFNENKECIYTNKIALELFGETQESILHKNIIDFIAPQSIEIVKHSIQISNKEPYEIWVQRADGSAFLALVRGRNMALAGKPVRVSAILDISQSKENEKKIFELAYYDALTTLPNREKLNEKLKSDIPLACAILNIDLFKEINDFFGLSSGDSILKQVGKWLLERGLDAYRIGGDEFAVIYQKDISWKYIHKHLNNLLLCLEEKTFIVDEEMFNITITIGVAIGCDRLLTRADIALHKAKEQKLSILLYKEQDNIEELYHKNITMTSTIRDALAHNRIICYYQPILNLKTNRISEYETLVRLINSKGEIILPNEFLAVAKKTKLYSAITREVVHQACKLFADREESDIENAKTVNEIFEIIIKTKTASRIIFEILEYEEIENFIEVAEFISKAKTLGAKIAIDDFGTGYSNFQNILKLNVDYIKIDGSLIQGILSNGRHSIIIETIVDFSKKVGAKTIAEFVSSKSIHKAVLKHDIDYSQGYFIGKPSPKLVTP